jgi:hypothetical protein
MGLANGGSGGSSSISMRLGSSSSNSRRAATLPRSRSLRAAAVVRTTSFPAFIVWTSRLTYAILAVVCYALVSTVWMEDAVAVAQQRSESTVVENNTAPQTTKIRASNNSNAAAEQRKSSTKVITVAYVVTITGCGHDPDRPFQIIEGAAVLRHSIHQNSIHGRGRYDYRLYAFHHPDAAVCAAPLSDLGYTVQERDTPVQVAEIQGDLLRERIVKNGCCGEKELIKLEAFTLTDHAIVVLLDLDVLVMKPLDRLFDFILDSSNLPDPDDLLRAETPIPAKIDLLYTTDFAMVNPGRKIKPTQGGFAVLRPNRTVYDDFVAIVRKGDFRDSGGGSGWGGETGRFWGAMTFQGLIPYYYQILHPGRAVELNWCVWNNMCSPSRDKGVENDVPVGECFTQQENCEDCRNRPVTDVGLIHFTVCQKPWTCQKMEKDSIESRLCRAFHHAWFQTRSDMEKSWGRTGWGSGAYQRDHFFGYCNRFGQRGYKVLAKPYGAPIAKARR